MSTYSLSDLLHKWSRGELSAEQAIGHLIQHAVITDQRLSEVEKTAALRARQLEPPPAKPQP
ncbi:MAG TPA: hypothetical protein PKE45_06320 [Caldilineaceae bacterium]|nr:hypothetical protein [Caldilineaceae bacterium]